MTEPPPQQVSAGNPTAALAPGPHWAVRLKDFVVQNFISVTAVSALAVIFFQWNNFQQTIATDAANRFAESVSNLASDEPGVQLGALYALQQIAHRDRETYLEPMLDILAIYVQDSAPVAAEAGAAAASPPAATSAHSRGREVRAALTILLRSSQLPEAAAHRVDLSHADLRTANFVSETQANTTLAGSDLRGVHFEESTLADVTLNDAKLANAKFADAGLTDVDFDGPATDLRGAWFSRATLKRVSFRDADVTGAHFFDATLDCVDFTKATLASADFGSATFAYVNLDGADLTGAKDLFSGSDSRPIVYYVVAPAWPETLATKARPQPIELGEYNTHCPPDS